MYWGDTQIRIATSNDLINWMPVEMKQGEQPSIPFGDQALNMSELKIVLPTLGVNLIATWLNPGLLLCLRIKGAY